MQNPAAYIHDQYQGNADLSIFNGTMHMQCLRDGGFPDPPNKKFIWNPKLLSTAPVRTMNIRQTLQVIDSHLGLRDVDFDVNGYIDPKNAQKDPTKYSFLVLKAIDCNKKFRETDQSEERLLILQTLVAELNGFDQLEFRPFEDQVQEHSMPPLDEVPEAFETVEIAPCPRKTELSADQQEQVRESQYMAWDVAQLVQYVLMLEETNGQLNTQVKQLNAQFREYQERMRPIMIKQEHILRIPDIVRSEFKKQKFLGIW